MRKKARHCKYTSDLQKKRKERNKETAQAIGTRRYHENCFKKDEATTYGHEDGAEIRDTGTYEAKREQKKERRNECTNELSHKDLSKHGHKIFPYLLS